MEKLIIPKEPNLKKFHLVYKTAATPYFPACLIVSCYSGGFRELLGVKLKSFPMLTIVDGDVVSWFFDKNLKRSAEIIFDKLFRSPVLMNKIKRKEKEISGCLLQKIKIPVNKLFDHKTLTDTGEKKLKMIFNLYKEYGEFIDGPGFLFQMYLVDDFKKSIIRFIRGSHQEKENIFNYLLTSYKLTNYERFFLALSQLAESQKINQKDIKRLADKYFWLIHDYLGDIIDEKYVKSKIDESKERHSHLLKRYEDALIRIAKIKKIKKDLPHETLVKVNVVQEILHMYNERKKEVANQVNIFIKNVFLYKYPGISIKQLKQIFQLSPDELMKLLKDADKINSYNLDGKKVYLMKNSVIEKGSDKYLELISNGEKKDILTGFTASPGKISGRVNMVLNVSHINKFKKGDILVAPFTNVNYLPIMGQAKAILTETGGMTSHAAIISRELKIPSVVGIKNLLASLKDGDMVEVDADKGIVKIIK
ncbi:MAG: PEP-utilizing enzyme [Patescibacteria group bacterium]|jgi:phosphohistidine swiveling domain-containing protein